MTPPTRHLNFRCANISSILFALQTFDSEEIVPLNADTSDVLRVLSNLCIQAHQQLIRIVEDRLQSIIGGVASRLRSSHFFFFFFNTFSHLLPPLYSLSTRSPGERDHRFFQLVFEAGCVQEASQLGPQSGGRRNGVAPEGAGSSSRSSDAPGAAHHPDGAGFPRAHLPHRRHGSEQPAVEEGHVLLQPGHADTVETLPQLFGLSSFELPFKLFLQVS